MIVLEVTLLSWRRKPGSALVQRDEGKRAGMQCLDYPTTWYFLGMEWENPINLFPFLRQGKPVYLSRIYLSVIFFFPVKLGFSYRIRESWMHRTWWHWISRNVSHKKGGAVCLESEPLRTSDFSSLFPALPGVHIPFFFLLILFPLTEPWW